MVRIKLELKQLFDCQVGNFPVKSGIWEPVFIGKRHRK